MNYAKGDSIILFFARFVYHKLRYFLQFKLVCKISLCLALEFFDFPLKLTV